MNQKNIECVPNFSEGRDMEVIRQITDAISSVDGVRVLHVDSGEAANRTVVTFAGEADAVCEAAFCGARCAGELIDMRRHHGTHPRIGATDVLPLVPVSGITLEECATRARRLAQRLAQEAGIPCYCYEAAALRPERKRLEVCRAGGYEALQKKLSTPDLQPDFLPPSSLISSHPSPIYRTGCTVVGARDFLIAVNFNLNTTSVDIAKTIAFDVRESGNGRLKCAKAIGWFIEEYGIAQVSMNLTDISVTSLHTAYEEVCRSAERIEDRGGSRVQVTGTEIIGLVPKRVLTDAGRHFLSKHGDTAEQSEAALIDIAIKEMGLDDLCPFDPQKKVLDYLL